MDNQQPTLLGIKEACNRAGIGRSFMYERMDDGSVSSVKAGRRRLIVAASLASWMSNLPVALKTTVQKEAK
jgi:excisionase family DNA binding protein